MTSIQLRREKLESEMSQKEFASYDHIFQTYLYT